MLKFRQHVKLGRKIFQRFCFILEKIPKKGTKNFSFFFENSMYYIVYCYYYSTYYYMLCIYYYTVPLYITCILLYIEVFTVLNTIA